MVTKEQAMNASYRDEFHYGTCMRSVGSRGGVKTFITTVRVNGQCETRVRKPNYFRLPFKYGMYDYGAINNDNAHEFHRAEDCPLNEEN